MTIQEATYYLLNKLRSIYSPGEASNITDWVMEHLTGSAKTERMVYKNSAITESEESQLQQFTERLLQHEPVQYVLNESWFCGLKLYVDKNVLIPRPETEELVEWIISGIKFPAEPVKILDIGSGSGCIPLALKKRMKKAEVWSCDNSPAALEIAKKNAGSLGMEVNFIQTDFLNEKQTEPFPSFDIIVSNPPYIPAKDKGSMQPNVLKFEPANALFVPDNDPLVFYKAIAAFGTRHLDKKGRIYAEIHEDLGVSVMDVFRSSGYSCELKKDMQQKDRMVRSGLE